MNLRHLPIPGYRGLYEACERGYIVSLSRLVRGRHGKPRRIPRTILQASVRTDGYLKVNLHKRGKGRTFAVSTLICLCFHGRRPRGHEVNHKNLTITDDRASNLEWLTHLDNVRHYRRAVA
jgi:HNH endonuclease/NUMOD4 motif